MNKIQRNIQKLIKHLKGKRTMFSISTKILSSLEKCFIDETLEAKTEVLNLKVLKNQSLSFQMACLRDDSEDRISFSAPVIEGEIAKYITAKEVVYVPSTFPAPIGKENKYYLRTDIGFYPDPIRPLRFAGAISLRPERLHCIWFDVKLPDDLEAKDYSVTISLKGVHGSEIQCEKKTVTVSLIDLTLPKQELIHTEWFYSDCIAEAHNVEVFSDKHFEIIESYLKVAVNNGINMILTPVFTPELDTFWGWDRPTTQLVKISVTDKDKYEFNFDLLGRWIDLCLKCGVEYFEMPHFYTQWGASGAPKFIATASGEEKKIFHWDTPSIGGEYEKFLSQFIPALVNYLKSKGVDKKCFFHVSDEPNIHQLEHYQACKKQIEPYLEGYPIIDALSNYEFYGLGVLKKPVPNIREIEEFVENNVEGLWTYYCGECGGVDGTGRCHGMPCARTRILGILLYYYGVEGFLHWGYNFFHNVYSFDYVNPFAETAAEYFAPSGDAFLVYPYKDEAIESQRLVSMREAMEDHRLLKLYESKYGREKTIEMLLSVAGCELTPSTYPRDNTFFTKLFDTVVEGMKK